jgi:hypothetical protein
MRIEEQKLNILLEHYSNLNEEIRNYRTIHWNIATMLFALMAAIVTFGLPNVEKGCGFFLVCSSVFLLYTLHITTYYYFQYLGNKKKKELNSIIHVQNLIIQKNSGWLPMISIEKINKEPLCIKPFKFIYSFFGKNKTNDDFWSNHPLFGFILILISLILLGLAFLIYPKNNQQDTKQITNPIECKITTNPVECSVTNHIECPPPVCNFEYKCDDFIKRIFKK